MAHDEIGGWCPKCDGEFLPGVRDCPDCGIPLLGTEERLPSSAPVTPDEASSSEPWPDPVWASRLEIVALVAAASIVAAVAGTVLDVLGFNWDDSFGGNQMRRTQQIQMLTRVASPGNAVVLLAAALAVAGAARFGPVRRRRRVAARSVFGASLLLGALATLGAIEDVRADDGTRFSSFDLQLGNIAGRLGVVVLMVVACWLTEVWRPVPQEER